ncbi:MAG: hypothetical protein IPK58_24175 [Acidobacteria bacterium]|nr:hypothetical protein [Acidobacteriota bacterium]
MLSVKVLADNFAITVGPIRNGWSRGRRYESRRENQINPRQRAIFSVPAGDQFYRFPDQNKLVLTSATGGLIAVIGNDNNRFLFIGASVDSVAPRDGALFLGVNEGDLNDNSGRSM